MSDTIPTPIPFPDRPQAPAAKTHKGDTQYLLDEAAWLLAGGVGLWEVERILTWSREAMEKVARRYGRRDVLDLMSKAAA